MVRICRVVALVSVLSLSLAGDGRTQDSEQRLPVFYEVQEVRVINVDVVVTDRKGNLIPGLSREDFEIFENGQPVEVSNFFAVEGGRLILPSESSEGEDEAGVGESESVFVPEAAPVCLIFFIDDINIGVMNRGRALKELRSFLESEWREGMRGMLVSSDKTIELRQGLTSSGEELLAALDELENKRVRGSRFEHERLRLIRELGALDEDANSQDFAAISGSSAEATDDSGGGVGASVGGSSGGLAFEAAVSFGVEVEARALLQQIGNYSVARYRQALGTVEMLRMFTDSVAGIPGRKIILYASDGLPMMAGEVVYEAYGRFAQQALASGPTISGMAVESARFDISAELAALAERAASSRVTFYPLDSSSRETLQQGTAERRGRVSGNFGKWDEGITANQERNDQDSLRLMAEVTGGRASLNPSTHDDQLSRMMSDLENYYALGYTAPGDVDETGREIEVKMKDRKLRVSHRRRVHDKSADERMAERLLAGLFVGEAGDNPLGVALESQEQTRQEDGTFVVPIVAKIPVDKLVLIPQASIHEARLSIHVAVQDEQGSTSRVVKHLCPVRIPNSELLVALGREAHCGVRLRMSRGEQTVAVGIRDDLALLDSNAQLKIEVGGAG